MQRAIKDKKKTTIQQKYGQKQEAHRKKIYK